MSENDEETLVRRRSRRSTAGNRMEAALAEFAALNAEPELEQEDDADFTGLADEEEIFDSDFQSTDDEAVLVEETAAERAVADEERKQRKSARRHALRNVDPPALRRLQKATQNAKATKVKKTRFSKRVSLGDAIDVETGETVLKRQSRRQSTMLASRDLNSRLKHQEARRALAPKRNREIVHELTQAELIARALDTEGGNIIEHRDYLEQEEEKRKRARVTRKTVSGPVLRWTSRVEEEKQPVDPFIPPNKASLPIISIPTQSTLVNGNTASSNAQGGYSAYQGYSTMPIITMPPLPPIPGVPTSVPSTQVSQQTKTVQVNKNYLVYEMGQEENAPKPTWEMTMETVFGDHVDWSGVKVYTGKSRPISRVVVKCPLTGRPAIYRDPHSGVPFANVRAYRALKTVLSQEYIWNEKLACYTACERDIDISINDADGDDAVQH